MESVEENIATTPTIFDLPLRDLLIPLAKVLKIQDIFSLRCCSRFFKEIGDEMLKDLKELVLVDPKYRCNEMTFRVLIDKCHKLRQISLVDQDTVVSLTDETLSEMLSSNPLLEEFYLKSTRKITCKALSPLATSCKKLVKLDIEGYLCNDGFLEMLTERNNQLLEIQFCRAWNNLEIPIDTFVAFFKKQPHLQRISLGLLGFYPNILSTIAEACKDLNCLTLPNCLCLMRNTFVAYDDPLRKLLESCPKLDTIVILDAPYVEVTYDFWQFLKSKNIRVEGPELRLISDSDSDEFDDYNFDDDPDLYEY